MSAEQASAALANYLELGCAAAAKRTGYEGFKADPAEATLVAKSVEPILARYLPQLDSALAEWALAIGTVGAFVAPRYFGYRDWKAAQNKPTPTASPTPPPKADAQPKPEEVSPSAAPLAGWNM